MGAITGAGAGLKTLFEINIQFSKYLFRTCSEILNLQISPIDQQISAIFYIAGMLKSLSTKKAKHDCLINAKSLGTTYRRLSVRKP